MIEAALRAVSLTVGGSTTRIWRGGDGKGRPVLFLHGGLPGISPYCGGSHLWGAVPEAWATERTVVLLDFPGSGGSDPLAGPLTVQAMAAHVEALLEQLQLGPVHVVGHDLGGQVGLLAAMAAPARIASVCVVASSQAAPTGDGVDNLTLLAPPAPRWSRSSQFWAYDRLSHSHQHIDAALLDASMAAAAGAAHRAVLARGVADPDYALALSDSVMRAKTQLFKAAREVGIDVPVQIVWSADDPLISRDHGFWLFKLIGARQKKAQFHLINRAGSFPFREQPEEFLRIVRAFQSGLEREVA